jgi:hypothetical protein
MRDASDVIFVVSAYLAAYNARAFGVKDYIAQLMFNSPPGLSDAMDLAKMLAILELIEPLGGPDFRILREVRTGLLSYPLEPAAARAHLAASIYVQMALKPQIVHIVGHTEADHAATADDVIEAAYMAQRVIENALKGSPDLTADPAVQRRKQQLMEEAQITLEAIRRLGPESQDPLIDQVVLEKAVTEGIMDAPQLKNNPFGKGILKTRIVNGACMAIGPDDQPIGEAKRLGKFLKEKDL